MTYTVDIWIRSRPDVPNPKTTELEGKLSGCSGVNIRSYEKYFQISMEKDTDVDARRAVNEWVQKVFTDPAYEQYKFQISKDEKKWDASMWFHYDCDNERWTSRKKPHSRI